MSSRILIVEGDEPLRRLIALELRAAFPQVELLDVGDGLEAIEHLLSGDAISLLVTDYQLPGVNGDVLARLSLAQRRNIPVILFTGAAPRSSSLPPNVRTILKGGNDLSQLLLACTELLDVQNASVGAPLKSVDVQEPELRQHWQSLAQLLLIGTRDHCGQVISRVLSTIQQELGADACFVAEFTGSRRVFRFVSGAISTFDAGVDQGDPLDETYCWRLCTGTLESVIPDAALHPLASKLAITGRASIGSHIGVPIKLSDGHLFGTICGMRHSPTWSWSAQELSLLRVAAELIAAAIEGGGLQSLELDVVRARTRQALASGGPTIVFQPIVALENRSVLGFEALSRFEQLPARSPDNWFDEAWSVGLGQELELMAVRNALPALEQAPPDTFLSVNLTHEVLLSEQYLDVLRSCHDPSRLVIEITEHSRILEYEPLRASLLVARGLGAKLAINDLGTGFSGLRHLVELAPDILKLDRSLVRGIETDVLRQIVAQSIVSLGSMINALVLAEGIETSSGFETLTQLGVPAGQGFMLGRPAPMPLITPA